MVKVAPSGKFARTHFEIVKSFPQATLLQAKPITGRTHQIRVHCAYMGNPILGDQKYGCKTDLKGMVSRLYLHAHQLVIELPYEPSRLTINSPISSAFDGLCKQLEALNRKEG